MLMWPVLPVSSTLMIEAACTSKMLVIMFTSTWYSHPRIEVTSAVNHHENLKSVMIFLFVHYWWCWKLGRGVTRMWHGSISVSAVLFRAVPSFSIIPVISNGFLLYLLIRFCGPLLILYWMRGFSYVTSAHISGDLSMEWCCINVLLMVRILCY
jgi:hypothetical protein